MYKKEGVNMYIVEVIEHDMLLTDKTNVNTCCGIHLVSYSKRIERRTVVGIFRSKENAEKCKRTQPEFSKKYQADKPYVIIREIDSDL